MEKKHQKTMYQPTILDMKRWGQFYKNTLSEIN